MKKEALEKIRSRNLNAYSKDAVADRAALLAHIDELEKDNRGLIVREIGMLLMAKDLSGVSYEAARATAKSKFQNKYPELADDWDF